MSVSLLAPSPHSHFSRQSMPDANLFTACCQPPFCTLGASPQGQERFKTICQSYYRSLSCFSRSEQARTAAIPKASDRVEIIILVGILKETSIFSRTVPVLTGAPAASCFASILPACSPFASNGPSLQPLPHPYPLYYCACELGFGQDRGSSLPATFSLSRQCFAQVCLGSSIPTPIDIILPPCQDLYIRCVVWGE